MRAPTPELLADIDPLEVRDRDALAALPVTRKSEMAGHQSKAPPFGGFAASGIAELARVFVSPGPIFEPQAHRDDYWRVARALHAAGVRRGDLLHNSFSYHLTPAGAMLESGAHALGCCVFPGGVGQTEFQVEAMSRLEASGLRRHSHPSSTSSSRRRRSSAGISRA